MGHRFRPRSREPWISGARDIERCRRLFDWTPAPGLTRGKALTHARMIVGATDLPVSADLERGFGDPGAGG